MYNTKTNHRLLCLWIFLLPLIYAAKPTITKSQQLKNKVLLTTTQAPAVQETKSYKQDILPESSMTINAEEEESENNFRLINEWKPDKRSNRSNLPWNLFGRSEQSAIFEPYSALAAMAQTSKMFHVFGYPQPIFIPYHVGITPEMLYANFAENIPTSEDNMSRARRPTNPSANFQRNSPIYYVRLSPTPYMFLPSFNYPSTTYPLNPYMHYPSMSSVFNLPINFLANGKPNGIYRIDDSSSNLQHERFPNTESQPNYLLNSLPPITSTLSPHFPRPSTPNFLSQHHSHPFGFGSPTPALLPETIKDSSKRPYAFNGRPEDIYILPNSFYSERNFY